MKIIFSILLPLLLYGQNWSFGINYSPLNTERVANFYGRYDYVEFVYESNGPQLKSEFSFSPVHRFRIQFNTGYDESYIERRYEYYYEDDNYSDESGYIYKTTFKIFLIEIGIKYYFSNNIAKQVSPFIITGFGKQFSKINKDTENIFNGDSGIEIIENEDEFLENLNSPTSVYLGFGSEYFINKTISIMADLQYIYSKVSGKYSYKSIIDSDYQTSISYEYQEMEITQRIGLGINFYF